MSFVNYTYIFPMSSLTHTHTDNVYTHTEKIITSFHFQGLSFLIYCTCFPLYLLRLYIYIYIYIHTRAHTQARTYNIYLSPRTATHTHTHTYLQDYSPAFFIVKWGLCHILHLTYIFFPCPCLTI